MLGTWDECGMGGWFRGPVLVEWQGRAPEAEEQFVGAGLFWARQLENWL